MMVPWWGWVLITLWFLPGVYCAVALLVQKPIRGLDEDGNVPQSVPLWRKLLFFPVVLVFLIVLWPQILWTEWRHSRQEGSARERRVLIDANAWGAGIPDEPAAPVEDQPEKLIAPQRVVALTEIGRRACLFPVRRVSIDPSWLTSDVVTLATGIDQEKAFDRMPILADALQDAGCDDESVLKHCRQPGGHVCGCWVVGLILGATTKTIIAKIDGLLASRLAAPEETRGLLRQLALDYWKVVFPEYGTASFRQLSTEEQERRWKLQREKNELTDCVDPHAVLRVLESPATGDRLLWVPL